MPTMVDPSPHEPVVFRGGPANNKIFYMSPRRSYYNIVWIEKFYIRFNEPLDYIAPDPVRYVTYERTYETDKKGRVIFRIKK